MHEEILGVESKAALDGLGRAGFIKDFYLAGGTGLALFFGHRKSYDLDFFTPKKFNERILTDRLLKLGGFSLNKKEWGTVHGIFRDTKVSFLHYPYPLLFKPHRFRGVRIADQRDIGCMKLDAIATRSSKKDFIDLHFLLEEVSLSRLLWLFSKKYGKLKINMVHVLKSLVYFVDARKDAPPIMLKPFLWEALEQKLEREVRNLL